jgi:hypothetical protein
MTTVTKSGSQPSQAQLDYRANKAKEKEAKQTEQDNASIDAAFSSVGSTTTTIATADSTKDAIAAMTAGNISQNLIAAAQSVNANHALLRSTMSEVQAQVTEASKSALKNLGEAGKSIR